MMVPMLFFVMIVAVVLALAAAAGAFVFATARAERAAEGSEADRALQQASTNESVQTAVDSAVERAVAEARRQATAERDAAVQAALQQAAVLQREQFQASMETQTAHLVSTTTQLREYLDAKSHQLEENTSSDLGAKKDLIDARLDQVHAEMRGELVKVTEMLTTLGQTSAQKFGEVDSSLRAHMEIANTLSESTQALRSALANPQVRGQWGERMAEDVLRLAGFVENVNYVKQTQIEGGTGRPDFTFSMPKGQSLFMDVKFPMAAYLRYLESGTDAERETHLKQFLTDVRARVKELAKREYATTGSGSAVDNVLLFIPNEQLTGFIHEHDPSLLEDAMSQQVVMCSPLTLFAFLGVIRQAQDNFQIEQTSSEILQLIGKFGKQWTKYADQVDKVKKRFDSVEREFDALSGTRRRALERPLQELESIRQERNLPVDGELFALQSDVDDETPPSGNVRQLGA
jgi:DNA recombination protein RmuC